MRLIVNKIFSIVLCCAMSFSLLPANQIIADDANDGTITASKTAEWADATQEKVNIYIEEAKEPGLQTTPNILFLGSLCGNHNLTLETIYKSAQAAASFGNVHYDLFQTSKDLVTSKEYHGDITMNSTYNQVKSAMQTQGVELGSSQHSTTYEFARVLEKATLGESGSGKTHYDYIVLLFDGMRMGYFYKQSSDDAADQTSLNAAAKVMKEYYAQDKVAWIISTATTSNANVYPYNYNDKQMGSSSTTKSDAFFYNDVYMDNDDSGVKDNADKTRYRDHTRDLIKLLAPEDLDESGNVPNEPYLDSNGNITDTFSTFRSRVSKKSTGTKDVKLNSAEGIWVDYKNADDVFSFLKTKIGKSLVKMQDTVVTGLTVSSVIGQYKELGNDGNPTGNWKQITQSGGFSYTSQSVTYDTNKTGTQIDGTFDLYKIYGENTYVPSKANAVRMLIQCNVAQLDLTKSDAIFKPNDFTINTNVGDAEIDIVNGPTNEEIKKPSPTLTMEHIKVTYHFVETGKPSGVDSMLPEAQQVKKNNAYTSVATDDITLTGYTFSGWYTDEGCTAKYTDGTELSADEDLYGKWSIKKYTVTWKNGTSTLETDTDVEHGSLLSFDGSTPTKDETKEKYYTFTGWKIEGTDDTALIDLTTYQVTSDLTLVAVFSETTKTPITINVKGNTDTVTYNATEQTVTGFTTDDLTGKDIVIALKSEAQAKAAGTNVGTYNMNLTEGFFNVTSHDYNVTLNVTDGYLVINKKDATITAENKTKVYSTADPEFTYIKDGIETADASKIGITLTRALGEDVNTDPGYTITPSATTGVDTNKNYNFTFVDGALTITQATIEPSKPESVNIAIDDPEDIPYDGSDHKWVPTVKDKNGTPLTEDDYEVSYDVTDFIGVKKIKVTITGKGNYKGTITKEYNITPIPMTVNIVGNTDSKVYNTAEQNVTGYEITTVLTDTDIVVNLKETSEAKAQGTNVGDYYMGLTADDFDVTSTNYTVTLNVTDGKLTITPKPVTIKAENKTKVFGETDPEFTYTIEGTDENDNITPTLTREPGEDVTPDGYVITPSVTDSNYTFTFEPAILTITPQAKIVNVIGNNNVVVFSGSEQNVTGYTTDDLTGTDIEIVLNDGSEAIAKGTNVDTYPMYLTNDSFNVTSDNYTVTLNITDGYLTINPKLILEEDVEVVHTVYNGDPQHPELKVIVDGVELVEGEDFTCEAEETPAGIYTITIKGIENYTGIVYKTWIIYPKAATIIADDKEKIFDENDPEFTSTDEGIVEKDNVLVNHIRELGENIGNYGITPDAKDDNYIFTFIDGILTIKPREISPLDVAVQDTTYNKEPQNPELVVVVNGKILTPGVDYICEDVQTDADTYEITIKGINNYSGEVLKHWTIHRLPITVKALDNSKWEGEKDPELLLSEYIGCIAKRDEGERPGTYKINVIVPSEVEKNYIVTTIDGLFTIKEEAEDYIVPNTSAE